MGYMAAGEAGLEGRGYEVLSGEFFEALGALPCRGDLIRHMRDSTVKWRGGKGRAKKRPLKRPKPGGLRHSSCRLPLLPSGPGGVRRRRLAQCLASGARGALAEREGFEPSVPCEHARFPSVDLKPLGHLSNGKKHAERFLTRAKEQKKRDPLFESPFCSRSDLSGERGIRTLETLTGLTVFETARFNRSRISPNKKVK